jgi:hypothetical protein
LRARCIAWIFRTEFHLDPRNLDLRTTLPLRRQFATALTLLYLVLVGVVPVAHARAEALAPVDGAHLVAWGEDHCPPVHDEAHCPACKVNGSKLVVPAVSSGWLGLFDRPSGVVLFHAVVDLPPSPIATPPSRAPPLA